MRNSNLCDTFFCLSASDDTQKMKNASKDVHDAISVATHNQVPID